MTKQTILDAVREELLSTNKLCGIDGFSKTDYTCLGMVSAALDRIDFDAAREDEAGKWEAQVVKLKDDIKELVDALDWLLVVKSYRDPNDKGEYYEIEKLGAREEANRLIKKHKNEKL